MTERIVPCRRPVQVAVNLPNGTSFVSRYKRISRKQLPGNIRVSRARTVDPRNKRKTKKNVRLTVANTLTQDRAKRIKKKNLRRTQTGNGLADNLANLGISMSSKAINSAIGKKLIDKGIQNIPNIFKYGVSKIKNTNVQRGLNSDMADYVIEETQNQAKNIL